MAAVNSASIIEHLIVVIVPRLSSGGFALLE
jgi:hypothetical protein